MEGIIASRNYNPGDVIYTEQAFAKVVKRKMKDIMCEFCCKKPANLRACKECLAVKYCDKECQKNDWESHKLECRHLQNLPTSLAADFVRLLGKVILKLKDMDWTLAKSSVLGKEFSFDEINCHYNEMTENPRKVLFFNEMKELTGNYIGFDKLPDDDNLIKIIGKVRYSAFDSPSIGFFIGTEIFSRECIPNASAGQCGNTVKIWASKTIKKGVDKIILCNQTILLPPVKFPDVEFINACRCADCSRPHGDSVLFKILDKKRAFTLIGETETVLHAANTHDSLLSLPETQQCIDRLLREQEGVLGETNYLRMGFLALKCFDLGGDPYQKQRLLLRLERSMRSVFGEYYVEMLEIYTSLSDLNLQLGNNSAHEEYARKAMVIERLLS